MPFQPFVPQPQRARFSEPVTDIIDVESVEVEAPKRSAWYRYRWALFVLAAIVWFVIGLHVAAVRVAGGVVLGFWFFAIGTMPHIAAARYAGEWFKGDD